MRMKLALEILKFGMGELRLSCAAIVWRFHSNLVKVHRLVQAHN